MKRAAAAILALAMSTKLSADDSARNRALATLKAMETIATAAEAYRTDMNRYPGAADITALAKQLEPLYIKLLPTKDGWGHDLVYVRDASSFLLVSAGADGRFDRDSWSKPVRSADLKVDAVLQGDGSISGFLRTWTDSSGDSLPIRAQPPPEVLAAEMKKISEMSSEEGFEHILRLDTWAEMQRIALAIDRYRAERGRYPGAKNIGELKEALFPAFIDVMKTQDHWGHDFRYAAGKDGTGYSLRSAGADGKFEAKIPAKRERSTSYNDDGVIVDGKIMRVWKDLD